MTRTAYQDFTRRLAAPARPVLGLVAMMAVALSFPIQSGAQQGGYFDPVGKHFEIDPDQLDAPNATPSARGFPRAGQAPEGAELQVPPGFKINVFYQADRATRGSRIRNIQVAPNGDFFLVNSSREGTITILRDTDGDGEADFSEVFAEGLNRPFGIAFAPGYIYVGNTGSVVRLPYEPGQTKAGGPPEKIADIPEGSMHWTRNVILSPDYSKLYISVGSGSNVGERGEEHDFHRASILVSDADGSNLRLFASGLRNPVGLDWNPATGELWTAVNERDMLGNDLVPDYTTSVKDGGFYGWPYFYIGANPQPGETGKRKPELASKVTIPDVLFTSHSASLGIAFYEGEMFPEEYRGDLFVAFHGSWNRAEKTGYKIVRVRMKDGKPVGGYENFMTGWLTSPDAATVWGRPVMVTVAPDGALLVVDDGASKVWRISYEAE